MRRQGSIVNFNFPLRIKLKPVTVLYLQSNVLWYVDYFLNI